jgi:hypothetical protein
VKHSVDLCLFTYRAISSTASLALNQMIQWSEKNGIGIQRWEYGNALIHRSRNDALAACLSSWADRPDVTHVLFVDDDMAPEPAALNRLLNLEKPVVSALCTTRKYRSVKLAVKLYDPAKDQFAQLDAINLAHPVTGPFAPGTAFLLIARDVVKQVVEYHLSGRDWLDENRNFLSRLHVRSEVREKERARLEQMRRALWENEKLIRVFDYPVAEDGHQLGEDICFARKLLNLGIDVTIDGTTPVYHMGEYPYSVADILTAEGL